MARPKGFTLNYEAFDDWLLARGLTRTEFSALAEIAPSSISGMTRVGAQKGVSLPVAIRMAETLRVRPGTLFPELVGRTQEAVVA